METTSIAIRTQLANLTKENVTSIPEPVLPSVLNLVVALYWIIGIVGILGNVLVIYIIIHDRRLRAQTMNLFLLNLAASDLLIMVIGVEEMAIFVLDRGWIFGNVSCKILRTGMVVGCYCSVLTLTSVCVERFVATVYPMKAQSLCTRSRVKMIIGLTWIIALASGIPTFYFLTVLPLPVSPTRLQPTCIVAFSHEREKHFQVWIVFRCVETAVFYLLPLLVQIVSYTIIVKALFVANKVLRGENYSNGNPLIPRRRNEENYRALQARQKIVQMLVICVLVYFTCYSPIIFPIAYHLVTNSHLSQGHVYQVVTLTMAYANSAANPILYTLFSDRYRRNFYRILCQCCGACQQRQRASNPMDITPGTTMNSKGQYLCMHQRGSSSACNTIQQKSPNVLLRNNVDCDIQINHEEKNS